jgi:threonine aldolase
MPTDDQILTALQASRGDNVYKEDATTAALEERIAKMAGKEACLFGASGTMTNQLAIRTHMKQPPHSVITDHRAHVHMMEAGGIALFSQATTHGLVPANGIHLTLEDIEPALQLGEDIHIAPTKLICLENTLSGMIFPQEEIVRISDAAKAQGIAMHLDGARAWNVAAAELERRGLDAHSEADRTTVLSDILAPFDTASLCLSKGIGAPVGSAIVGSKEFIARARWFWKMFGGGWRQSGVLASMADYGLTNVFPRLAYTHALARRLADGLEAAGCDIVAPVDTSMVFFDPSPIGLGVNEVAAALGALDDPITLTANRCVIHHQTSIEAVDDFVAEVTRLANSIPRSERKEVKKAAGLGYGGA